MATDKSKQGSIPLHGSGDPESLEEARQRIIEEVMTEQQRVSSAWSLIDGPFAQPDTIEDHHIVREEFRALIGRIVHLPDSVEGIRYLKEWFDFRMAQIAQLKAGSKAGKKLVWGIGGSDEIHHIELTEDSAKAVRIALELVESLFFKFPVTMVPVDSMSADGGEDEADAAPRTLN